MRNDREQALALRLKGYSYSEINKLLEVPKATLSNWFSDLVLSEKAAERIASRVRKGSLRGLIKRNRLQTHQARKQAQEIRSLSKKELGSLSERELLLIGAALYWAEGYKKPQLRNGIERSSHAISFTNSDPLMVRGFVQFLKQTLDIPENKISGSIRIYEHINEDAALNFWIKVTDLPKENFRKTYYGVSKSSLGKRPYNRLPYGTIQIRVGDTKNFHRMMGWIEGIKQVFLNKS